MTPKRRERRRAHHEKQWLRWYWKVEKASQRQDVRHWEARARHEHRRVDRSVHAMLRLPQPKFTLFPAYGLCPTTGTFHKLESWDMALGCIDCGWEDWTTGHLADGRPYNCLCCHKGDGPGATDGSRSPVESGPALGWTEKLAARLKRQLPKAIQIVPSERLDIAPDDAARAARVEQGQTPP